MIELTSQATSTLPVISQAGFFNNFWPNLTATFLGAVVAAVLGVPFALWVNRRIINHNLVYRRDQLLTTLRETLTKNRNLLQQVEDNLNDGAIIFYNVDMVMLESTASFRYEVIEDSELNSLIDSITYELMHFHRKVELQLDIHYGVLSVSTRYEDIRTELNTAITQHMPRIRREITSAVELIDRHLSV